MKTGVFARQKSCNAPKELLDALQEVFSGLAIRDAVLWLPREAGGFFFFE